MGRIYAGVMISKPITCLFTKLIFKMNI